MQTAFPCIPCASQHIWQVSSVWYTRLWFLTACEPLIVTWTAPISTYVHAWHRRQWLTGCGKCLAEKHVRSSGLCGRQQRRKVALRPAQLGRQRGQTRGGRAALSQASAPFRQSGSSSRAWRCPGCRGATRLAGFSSLSRAQRPQSGDSALTCSWRPCSLQQSASCKAGFGLDVSSLNKSNAQ